MVEGAYQDGLWSIVSGVVTVSGNVVATSISGATISGAQVTLSGTVAQVTSGVVQAYLSGGTASLSGLILTSGIFFASGIGITLSGTTVQIASGVAQVYSGLISILQVVASGAAYTQAGAAFSTQSGISGLRSVIMMGTQAKLYTTPFGTLSGQITFVSGGVALSSGQVAEVILRNRGMGAIGSGNIFYVGTSGTNTAPASGFGFPILSGETITLHVDNLNKINVWSATSGSILTWMAT